MFGYIKTDIPNMYVKDTILYKSMYCGLCKSIGCTCGNVGRFCLNYDLTFLSVLLHNVCDIDIKIEKKRCIAHWFIKRPIAKPDSLSKRIACLNIIMAYHKILDDVEDNNKGRGKRAIFKSSYKKAVKLEPELSKIVSNRYNDLTKYEKANGDSIDIAADPFGNMVKEVSRVLTEDLYTEELGELCYFIGKWIYLIDALDDFDKDKKNKNYNVFVNYYKDNCKSELLKNHNEELKYTFGCILNTISEYSYKLNYKFNHDLIDNILLLGLKEQTKKIIDGDNKCKKSIKY